MLINWASKVNLGSFKKPPETGRLHLRAGGLSNVVVQIPDCIVQLQRRFWQSVVFYNRSNGEGEIRTPATLAGRPVFETGAFNHSATSPNFSKTIADAAESVK